MWEFSVLLELWTKLGLSFLVFCLILLKLIFSTHICQEDDTSLCWMSQESGKSTSFTPFCRYFTNLMWHSCLLVVRILHSVGTETRNSSGYTNLCFGTGGKPEVVISNWSIPGHCDIMHMGNSSVTYVTFIAGECWDTSYSNFLAA